MVTIRTGDSKERDQHSSAEGVGGRIGSQIKNAGNSLLSDQKNRACEELDSISDVAHEAAERFHERDDHMIAESVDALANEVRKTSDFIREHSVQEMIERVNTFARKSPEVFLGGAVVLGLVIGRFLKASQHQSSTHTSVRPHDQQSDEEDTQLSGGLETHLSNPSQEQPHQSQLNLESERYHGEPPLSGRDVRAQGGRADVEDSQESQERYP